MASNFPDNRRQIDWELFSPDDYNDRYLNDPAYVTIDQVEDIGNHQTRSVAAPRPVSIRLHSEDNARVTWNSGTTPTQTPAAFLSSYYRSSPPTTTPNTMTGTSQARQGLSPSSSPRLPSPPPYTEVQIGPKSPSISERGEHDFSGGARKEDDSSSRRIRPGTKSADMASGPPLVPLAQLDSPFQLQEHLKALYHTYTRSSDPSSTTPITRDTALILATPPEGIDRQLWLYELCRFLTMRANNLIIAFFADIPPCSSHTCPEMRASEWQYLCAVHDPPKSCCAIDYCCHTLDWATNVLTSPKYFPSRLTLGSEAAGGAQASMRHLTNIFRRVYRIFAHAWFQHRGVFWQVEGHDGLYVFFKTVCDAYALIPEDNYTIPPEAEGHGLNLETPISTVSPQVSILKNSNLPANAERNGTETSGQEIHTESEPTTTISTGATTRRHKHTPSTGTNVTTITEGEEEEGERSEKEHSSEDSSNAIADAPSKEQVAETDFAANGLSEPDLNKDTKQQDTTETEPATLTTSTSTTEAEKEGEIGSEEHDQSTSPEQQHHQSTNDEQQPSSGTTLETLEQKVADPANQGAKNTADSEVKEETSETAPQEAAA